MKRVSLVTVLVRDQDEAIAFYRDKLGFLLAEDMPFGPQRWVTMQAPDDRTVALSLCRAETAEDRALVGRQGGSRPLVALAIDDCLGEYTRMKARGVVFHGEPQVHSYGAGVVLEDLYGNRIYLNQEPA